MSLESLIEKYAGRLYCDELLNAIRAVTDNNIFLEDEDVTLIYALLENDICTDAYYALRDTVYRNAENGDGDDVIVALFQQRGEEIAFALRCAPFKTLHAFAEIIPKFSELVMGDAPYYENINALWEESRYFSERPCINILERIDFIVTHAQDPRQVLYGFKNMNLSRFGEKRWCVLDFVCDLPIESTLSFLVKWIRRDPSLLQHVALARYRDDITRWFLEQESELSQELLSVVTTEDTSLSRIVATVLTDQTELLAHQAQRK